MSDTKRPLDIKTLEWCGDEYAFFCSGHVERDQFLADAEPVIRMELGDALDEQPAGADVQHAWFGSV